MRDASAVVAGLCRFFAVGAPSPQSRIGMLNLHCSSNGLITDWVAALVRQMRPPRAAAAVTGVLGELSPGDQKLIAKTIARDGYYVFERRLSPDMCDALERLAATTPAVVEGRRSVFAERVIFDAAAPISKTYRLVEEDCVRDPTMQRLMADPTLVAVAESYLRMMPSLVGVNLWWSPAFGNEPGADAAQQFHFDFDPPPVWLLIFVYLTDVGPDNGPHVFARGSHLAGHHAAKTILKRGYVRISDEEIANAFGSENMVELPGKRGTILAVDTRGFHKGKMPTVGARLIAQLTYASPLFTGERGLRVQLASPVEPALAAAMAANPTVYERYR